MTQWIFYKAKPHEKKNMTKKMQRQMYCRICGVPIYSGTICPECNKFIKQKQQEERNKRK